MATGVETLYARSGDVNIAYQVVGEGPLDLVLVPGWVSHLDVDWEGPELAYFLRRLAGFSRLIRFDKRGTGLSDRNVGLPDLETRMDDVRAVMDAVGSERAALYGYSEGGPMCCLFAATYPERVSALVLYGSYAKRRDPDDDYPWAATWAERQEYAAQVEREWGVNADEARLGPTMEEATRRWWLRRARSSASPAAARDLILMNSQIDIRHVLPTIGVPTLVMHRRGDADSRWEEGRYLADGIAGARFVLLEGSDHLPWADGDQVLDEIEGFLTGVRRGPDPDRVLATILFTDLVDSTRRAVELGDRRWADLVAAHHAAVRARLEWFRGEELDTAGDGFFAVFDGPARAVRCALAIRDAVRELGLEIRAGVHTGEAERVDGKVAGLAVNVGARVAATAKAGEVIVSSTVRDLVAGSGLEFEDRGSRELKGLPGEWRLFAAQSA
ncbi:MAG: adenylate/guanylate cyclase domain-containing protein [Thermoleophilia bacterium]|nr:adenylate/guanylate cyclase domain-containing protein [Thermoleophilia bacterium]